MNREEAIHELQEDKRLYETEVCHAGDGTPDGRLLEALDMAIEALRNEPKTGEWKCMGDCGVTECGQCGWSIEEYVGDYNFCPNCGADMRGGDE